jgi:hypothetical protein
MRRFEIAGGFPTQGELCEGGLCVSVLLGGAACQSRRKQTQSEIMGACDEDAYGWLG